jgi:hypothetical protein
MGKSKFGAACAITLGCGGAACGEAGSLREFEPAREVRWASAATAAQASVLSVPGAARARGVPNGPRLAYDAPPGWKELAPTSMRAANFLVAGDPRAECVLTLLAGDAGGLTANVQRWRGQMGAPPLDASAIAALPRVEFFGGTAAWLDVRGAYTSMGSTSAQPDHRLVGLLRIDAGGSAFLKLTGPANIVERELGALRGLARSFRAVPAPSPDGRRGAPDEPDTPDSPSTSGTPSTPSTRNSRAAGAAPDSARAGAPGGLAWQAPAGWTRGPDRPTRAATFLVGAEAALECSVTTLAGAAGGARANVDRWRGQLQREPLSAAEFEALERVVLLGSAGLYVAIESGAPADGAAAPALLLGAVVCTAERSVFVKLVGPRERVLAARADFRAFCASLRVES